MISFRARSCQFRSVPGRLQSPPRLHVQTDSIQDLFDRQNLLCRLSITKSEPHLIFWSMDLPQSIWISRTSTTSARITKQGRQHDGAGGGSADTFRAPPLVRIP